MDNQHDNNRSEPIQKQPEQPKNSEYLKRYIESHPDNQMAWYLLGREYADKGQHDKAKYCFIKAGEVYEVFEQTPIHFPSHPLPQKRTKRFVGRTLILIVLFFIITHIPIDHPNEQLNDRISEQNVNAPLIHNEFDIVDSHHSYIAPEVNNPIVHSEMKIYYTNDKDSEQLERALMEMIFPTESLFHESILVQAPTTPELDWIQWTKKPKFILSALRDGQLGRLNMDYYDAEMCVCIPSDPTRVKEEFALWQAAQEQHLVLSSAIQAYQRIHGTVPNSLDDMAQNYPHNMLPGYSETMIQIADLVGLDHPTLALQDNQENSDPNETIQRSEEEIVDDLPMIFPAIEELTQPLEIIVDKQNHRLALVSGRVILRNYPVGLGGDKTPEGEFHLSEKVRDPNGRSDGDFGSRGMTLSDTLYAIHGTNEPESIGKDESLGCIRMLKDDIEELFDMVPLGTKVTITNHTLPDEIMRSAHPFSLPALAEETNPNKVYNWLD